MTDLEKINKIVSLCRKGQHVLIYVTEKSFPKVRKMLSTKLPYVRGIFSYKGIVVLALKDTEIKQPHFDQTFEMV